MKNEFVKPQTKKSRTDVVELTQNLVRIPSFVNIKDKQGAPLSPEKRTDETRVNSYIANFLTENVPGITIQIQDIGNGRNNIIATRGEDPKLLLLGHTDTVFPSLNGTYDPFGGDISDGKLYGLGATDMKGGVAVALSAMAETPEDVPLAAIFYADEEFNFEGMKALIEEKLPNINPELLFSLDGGNMELGLACRGIMQLRGIIRGISAHAGRPQKGIDAISGTEGMLAALRKELEIFTNDTLGATTVNRAALNGGKEFIDADGVMQIIEQGNAVPDIAQFVLDIRPSSTQVTPDAVKQIIFAYCQKNNLTVNPDDFTTDFAYGAWITDKNDVNVQNIAQIMESTTGEPPTWSDPKTKGYIDMQMLWESLSKPAAVMTGPGTNSMAHKPDEYVEIEKLQECRDVVLEVIQRYGRRSKPEKIAPKAA